eukprot:7071802-Prymnesium_polylepis.1
MATSPFKPQKKCTRHKISEEIFYLDHSRFNIGILTIDAPLVSPRHRLVRASSERSAAVASLSFVLLAPLLTQPCRSSRRSRISRRRSRARRSTRPPWRT